MFPKMIAALLLLLAGFGPVLAQGFEISEVVILGNRRVEQSAIRAVLSATAGRDVSLEEIDRDIRAMFRLGRFQDITAAVEEQEGKRVLIYRLTERPLVREISFSGNKELSEEKLRAALTFKAPDFYRPRAVEKSLAAIRKLYEEEGYHAARIEPKLTVDADNAAKVLFSVREGEKVLIGEIRFSGNTVFSDGELRKVMETKEKWIFSWLTGRGAYKEEVLQNDLELIADQYFNRGYIQVKVKQPLVRLDAEGKNLDVLIEIEEGEQFRVGRIDLQGDLLKSREDLLALVRMRSGEVFSRQQLRSDVFALNDLYADRGYAYVNISPLTRIDAESRQVDVTFKIEQGVEVHIDRIRVSGNTRTRDKVIRREMKLVEGDLYSSTALKESRRKVNNLGFFEQVNVATSKGPDESLMNVDVEVKERPTGTFSIGFGYSSVDGLIGQGSVTQDNFLGKALKLNLAGSFGGKSTTYQVGLTEPYFLDRNLTLGFDLYKIRREWLDFTKKTNGGDIKLGFPLAENTRAFFLYKYEQKEITDVDRDASLLIREQEGKSTLSSIYAAITRNTTDYHLDPSRGMVSELSGEFAGLGGSQKFAKYIFDQRFFFPAKWDTVFSLHGQVGYVQEVAGEEIPIDERFFLGGINSIRGFSSREVGPRVRRTTSTVNPATGATTTSVDYEFVGGTKQAFFNFEYIFPVIKDAGLKGLVFFDTGNAWGEDEEFFSDLRYSVGAGLRWFSPLGPLRLEWGYNLDPKEDEEQSQFEFSIGRFF